MKSVEPQSALRGTALLFLGRILSRILGLGREVLAASFFGAGRGMDCFNLSFTFVTSMRQLFAEQFHTPIVPTYFQQKKENGMEAALRSIRVITTRLNVFTILICIAVFIWAHSLVSLVAPGFSAEKVDLSATMLRWFAVGGFGIILHRYYVGLHTCFFRYTAIAFAPLLLNVITIAVLVIFASRAGIVSLASGISLGFLAYVIVLYFLLPHRSDTTRLECGKDDPGVSRYSALLIPLFIAVSFEQVQLFVDRALASGLPEGALSAQGYAYRLVRMFSDFLIGTVGTVIFPVFSSLAVRRDKSEFFRNFSMAVQSVVLMLSIAGSLIICFSLPMVKILLERGAFTEEASQLTASLVVYYTVAFFAQALLVVMIRGFHALGNTRTPVITTVISVIVMIIADFMLIGPMGIHGLALATAIGYLLNLVLVYVLFTRKLPQGLSFMNLKMLFIGIFLALSLGWGLSRIWKFVETQRWVDSFFSQILGLVLLSAIAVFIYLLILHLLRVPALEFIIEKLRKSTISDRPPDLGAE
ncbi:murein biosynthesis integral membrane protein MurJ [candidate division LCP-89 bacterium B3_LCP]|uniref:Lipid II flippase n=1 Tax=candidate division LCP-89 bacterium B3_LCP TaxID=2012998 RepID=A0A532UZ23_UNCL8|nr:MAG: murein biosynthesis integral membrane protein MurJ [candidate division LCP-89 bacterium B3_LCP]